MKKRKDGLYAAQVYLGTDDGKRRYKTVYGKTQKEVKAAVSELKIKMGKGIDVAAADEHFDDWCDLLIRDKRALGVSSKQIENLRSYKNHLSMLWDVPLSKATTAQLQNILNRLSEWHDGKRPLAKTTIRKVNNFAKQVFDKAIGARITDYNPARYVAIAQGEASTRRIPIEERQKAWIAETPHGAKTAAMIMLYAGLRRGEVLALTWADVNLNTSTILVNKAVEFVGNIPAVKGTKTEAGTREVSIPQVLTDYLRSEKGSYLYVVHDGGKMYTDSKWDSLWHSYMVDLDVKYGYNNEVHKFSPKRKGFRIKIFTPHQLRHTYATMLYLAGIDVMEAKYQLGHSDIKVTLGIYTHFEKQYNRTGMSKLNGYLSADASSMQVKNQSNG